MQEGIGFVFCVECPDYIIEVCWDNVDNEYLVRFTKNGRQRYYGMSKRLVDMLMRHLSNHNDDMPDWAENFRLRCLEEVKE